MENKALFVADDGTPDIVRDIFNTYVEGVGFDAIAWTLSKKGIPTPSTVAKKSNHSKFWHGSTVKKILSNPHYIGDLVQGRDETISVTSNMRRQIDEVDYVIVKDTHEPIISREQFALVQQLMKTRKRQRPKSSPHLFTNFLYCHDCKSGMWYRSNRSGYICGSYSRHGSIACSQHLTREQRLIDKILSDLNGAAERLNNNDMTDNILKQNLKKSKQLQKELAVIEEELTKISSKKRKYLELLSSDVITHQEYRDAMNDLYHQTETLNTKKSELIRSLQLTQVNAESKTHIESLLQQAPFTKVTKTLLAAFVKRIEVKEDGELMIQYHSPYI